MNSISINDKTYWYHISKQNDTLPYLLMLHGFMGEHCVFDHLTDELSTFCNPVTIDLLGHGKSSKPAKAKAYHGKNQIADLVKIIGKLRLSPVYLYGYSMGGRLALQTAIENPDLFSGLILESTNPGISDKNERQKRRETDAGRAHNIEDDFLAFLDKWKGLDLFQSPMEVDNQLAEKYYKIQTEQYPEAMAASLRGFGTGSMSSAWDELENLYLPALILAGSVDEKYQKITNKMVNKLPNATFCSTEAGHRVHLDNQTKFVQNINHFITMDMQ